MFGWFRKNKGTAQDDVTVLFQGSDDSPPQQFQARKGERLFDVLHKANADVYSVCGGGGLCGECKVRLVKGDLASSDASLERRLTGEAYDGGMRLACQSRLIGDVSIAGACIETRKVSCKVTAVRQLNATVIEIVLRPGAQDDLRFASGQHISVHIADGSDKGCVRAYSIVDAYSEYRQSGTFRLVIRQLPGGRSSSHLFELAVGDTLDVSQPFGGFDLTGSKGPVVMVGGGVGIAPMLALASQMRAEEPGRRFAIWHGVRSEDDSFYARELASLAADGTHIAVCPSTLRGGEQKHLAQYLTEHYDAHDDLSKAHFLLCGPPPMVQSSQKALQALGVPSARIQADSF